MSRASRVLLLLASALLALMLAAPLWRIQLIAPQYPEGLGMKISANTVRGQREHDLDNINELNHYIGMKRIEPESIPELHIIPYAIAALAAAAVLVALIGRRELLSVWLGAFATVAVIGLIDFWHWEYDYGHHLDLEHAIIKVPGMSYQPPLIGSKQLLNFTAVSVPDVGGVLAGVAFLLGVAALVLAYRSEPRPVADWSEPQ